jgi:hypothetical protein
VVFLWPLFFSKSFSFCIFTPLTMLDLKVIIISSFSSLCLSLFLVV